MKTSGSIELLATALSAAQGEFPKIEKNRTNSFFKSSYADLEIIIATCKPVLGKYGLAVIQPISFHSDGFLVITTVILHKSGQWLSEELWLRPKSQDVQEIGKVITYGRRYAYQSMVGVVAEDDDDGNSASVANAPVRTANPAPVQKPEGKMF